MSERVYLSIVSFDSKTFIYTFVYNFSKLIEKIEEKAKKLMAGIGGNSYMILIHRHIRSEWFEYKKCV